MSNDPERDRLMENYNDYKSIHDDAYAERVAASQKEVKARRWLISAYKKLAAYDAKAKEAVDGSGS